MPAKAGNCFFKARGFSPVFLLFLLFILPSCLHAQTIPHFRTAADARAWGEAREQAHQYEAAADAYEQEAAIRNRTGDPQAAEIEHRRAERLRTDLVLAITAPVPIKAAHLAKLEPVAGCYLGALDNYADGDDADHFGQRIGRPLAVCFDYSPYGAPFPMAWAQKQAQAGRAIQIAWEPSDIGAVQDDEYLNQWAKDAGSCGTPVFLRFGGEMNGNWTLWGRDPLAYQKSLSAGSCCCQSLGIQCRALVWAPGAVPTYNLDLYYPGDDVVDWVGISLYLVRFYDDNLNQPAWHGRARLLDRRRFMTKYAARKPLCLVPNAGFRAAEPCGRRSGCGLSLRRPRESLILLDAIKIRFPRLKMFCWFTRNNLETAGAGRRLNDYSLPEGSAGAVEAFRSAATSDPYFLSAHLGDVCRPTVIRSWGINLPSGVHRQPERGHFHLQPRTPTLEDDDGPEVTRGTDHGLSASSCRRARGPLTVQCAGCPGWESRAD